MAELFYNNIMILSPASPKSTLVRGEYGVNFLPIMPTEQALSLGTMAAGLCAVYGEEHIFGGFNRVVLDSRFAEDNTAPYIEGEELEELIAEGNEMHLAHKALLVSQGLRAYRYLTMLNFYPEVGRKFDTHVDGEGNITSARGLIGIAIARLKPTKSRVPRRDTVAQISPGESFTVYNGSEFKRPYHGVESLSDGRIALVARTMFL